MFSFRHLCTHFEFKRADVNYMTSNRSTLTSITKIDIRFLLSHFHVCEQYSIGAHYLTNYINLYINYVNKLKIYYFLYYSCTISKVQTKKSLLIFTNRFIEGVAIEPVIPYLMPRGFRICDQNYFNKTQN